MQCSFLFPCTYSIFFPFPMNLFRIQVSRIPTNYSSSTLKNAMEFATNLCSSMFFLEQPLQWWYWGGPQALLLSHLLNSGTAWWWWGCKLYSVLSADVQILLPLQSCSYQANWWFHYTCQKSFVCPYCCFCLKVSSPPLDSTFLSNVKENFTIISFQTV